MKIPKIEIKDMMYMDNIPTPAKKERSMALQLAMKMPKYNHKIKRKK